VNPFAKRLLHGADRYSGLVPELLLCDPRAGGTYGGCPPAPLFVGMVLDAYRGKAVKDGKKCSSCGAINLPGAFGCKSCLSDVAFAEVQQYPESYFESQQDKIRRSKPLDHSDGSRERAMSPLRFFARAILVRLMVKVRNNLKINDR